MPATNVEAGAEHYLATWCCVLALALIRFIARSGGNLRLDMSDKDKHQKQHVVLHQVSFLHCNFIGKEVLGLTTAAKALSTQSATKMMKTNSSGRVRHAESDAGRLQLQWAL